MCTRVQRRPVIWSPCEHKVKRRAAAVGANATVGGSVSSTRCLLHFLQLPASFFCLVWLPGERLWQEILNHAQSTLDLFSDWSVCMQVSFNPLPQVRLLWQEDFWEKGIVDWLVELADKNPPKTLLNLSLNTEDHRIVQNPLSAEKCYFLHAHKWLS